MPMRTHEDIAIFCTGSTEYNPQKTSGHIRKVSSALHKRNSKKTDNYGKHGLNSYDSTERYPVSIITFPTDKQKSSLHPTQKPVALFEYLIKTYTNEGEVVLDNCSGSGTTAIAALNTNRKYICMEKDETYFNKSVERVKNHRISATLPI